MERTDHHLLTLKDVASALGRSPGTVRQMINEGKFPEGFPAPDKLYWRWGVVRQWIERQELLAELKLSDDVKPRKPLETSGNTLEPEKDSSQKDKRR